MKRKNSLFSNELDEEWEDFLVLRMKELPPLPVVHQHGGHGHGHHHGPIDHDKIRKLTT